MRLADLPQPVTERFCFIYPSGQPSIWDSILALREWYHLYAMLAELCRAETQGPS